VIRARRRTAPRPCSPRRIARWRNGWAARPRSTTRRCSSSRSRARRRGVGHTDEAIDACALLARACARGRRIEFPAQVDELESLRDWLEQDLAANGLEAAEFEVMYTVLHDGHEHREHGLGGDPRRRFEMWNVPEGRAVDGAAPATGHLCFLIRDDGQPFRPGAGRRPISPIARRRRGRGIGLDISAARVSCRTNRARRGQPHRSPSTEHLSQTLRERRHA
jgi:hypothetical protein